MIKMILGPNELGHKPAGLNGCTFPSICLLICEMGLTGPSAQ